MIPKGRSVIEYGYEYIALSKKQARLLKSGRILSTSPQRPSYGDRNHRLVVKIAKQGYKDAREKLSNCHQRVGL